LGETKPLNMKFSLKLILICLLIICLKFPAFTQIKANDSIVQNTIISIQQIGDIQNHYAELQLLSSDTTDEYSWMDKLTFPPEEYKNYSVLFALSNPVYLTSDQVSYLSNSVNHPPNSSIQTRAELKFLLELQNNRTDIEVKRVMYLADIGYWPDVNYVSSHPNYHKNLKDLFFECTEVVGQSCSHENFPKTSKLLQGIMNDTRLMEFAVKYRLRRARPYQLENKLEPLQRMGSPSFASGHTLWAYSQAFAWGELMPEKREAFLNLAYEIGLSREIMGVHYPSDEEASRQLAHRMILLMWHTEKFQRDFEAAKSEWD